MDKEQQIEQAVGDAAKAAFRALHEGRAFVNVSYSGHVDWFEVWAFPLDEASKNFNDQWRHPIYKARITLDFGSAEEILAELYQTITDIEALDTRENEVAS